MRLLALVALTGVLVSGCGGSRSESSPSVDAPESSASNSPSPTPAADPPADPPADPAVGQCHRLGFDDAAQPEDDTAAIPCRTAHTSQTVKVGRLDALVAGAVDTESEALRAKVAAACPTRLLRYAGGSQLDRRLSRLEIVWFLPAPAAVEAGAGWFRCDIVGVAGADRLIRLPRTTKEALETNDALDRFGTCGTKAPGKPGFERVVCRRTHAWRAVDTVDFDDSTRYLGRAAAARGDTACKDVAAARADGALRYTWSFEWPTRAQWRAGDRYGFCWIPD